MPIESEAQRRWAYANKDKPTAEGRAAADFVRAGPSSDHLPERKTPSASKKHSLQSLVSRKSP